MPHRIYAAQQFIAYFIEGALFSIGLAWAGGKQVAATLIDRETMDQLRSGDGALFGAAVIVVALWISKIADSKRMDKRHDEMIKTMKESSAENKALVVESIRSNAKVYHVIDTLVVELKERPCNAGKPLSHTKFDPMSEP